MPKVTEYFGSNVFNETVMKARLPKPIFELVQRAIHNNKRLDSHTASVVAAAMKDWAIEKGATHYTHWFQPMTGITAEKHDSFITPAENGKVIMEFRGKELIHGEADASSFPSGGLRATFEARGYTAWDPTSFAFIKEGVLCIPTAFCSYGGEALDKKTPLLRSMEAINREALRVLRLFGNNDVTAVKTTVGPEQEYFLIDKETFLARKDLVYTGRTLFGAMPPKGQELDDHYFGTIKSRVKAFMTEVDEELWRLGVLSKTEHNEAAPAQHELAPIFATTNIAVDHNQLTMELLQRIAKKHDLICLLHEKPFDGVNGSGKHNNWSISTSTGANLLEPGETPYENAQFLLFLCAVIKAVDDYQDLLRISVASAGNDHRLGALEAPPAVVSMFLGDELCEILEAIEKDIPYAANEVETLKVGVHVLPKFPKDTTDRNRTAPIAFTGNKFEFRMLGSSDSAAEPNVILNTAVAESLRLFADELESASDFETALHDLIAKTIAQHKRIIFNGNCYDEAWIAEAKNRGLCNFPTTPDCLPHLLDKKNIDLFATHRIYAETELRSRLEIMLENYCKILNIEARTMVDMACRDILPAVSDYITTLADAVSASKIFETDMSDSFEAKTAKALITLKEKAFDSLLRLEAAANKALAISCLEERAIFYKDKIAPIMAELRASCDAMERLTAADFWPMPTYGDLLFGVM